MNQASGLEKDRVLKKGLKNMDEQITGKEKKNFMPKVRGFWASLADTIQISQFLGGFLKPTLAKALIATATVGVVGGVVLVEKNVLNKKLETTKENVPTEEIVVQASVLKPVMGDKVAVEEDNPKSNLSRQTLEFVSTFTAFINERAKGEPQAALGQDQDSYLNELKRYRQETQNLYFSDYQQSVIKFRLEFLKQDLSNSGLDRYYELPTYIHELRSIAAGLTELANKLP